MKIGSTVLLVFLTFLSINLDAQRLDCGSNQEVDKLKATDVRFARAHERFLRSIRDKAASRNRNSRAPILRIPVVVHVIHDGEPIGTGQNLSEGRIQAQIDVLNQDFNAMHPSYANAPVRWKDDIGNAEIQFCLASIDPQGNPTNGITRDQIEVTGTDLDDDNIETDIKPPTHWPTHDYLNIYTLPIPGTTAGGGTTGYAYYPSSAGSVRDGAVVDYRWFGGPGFGQSASGTLTHEVGHYLGLPHPFDGESCSADDGIADTPNIDHPSPNVNCNNGWPTGDMSCGNEAMYINFMDYSGPDQCVNSFTNDQIAVMRATLGNERLVLANNATAVCAFFDYDIAAVEINTPGISSCSLADVTPSLDITNFGLETVTNLTIYYQINSNTPIQLNWVDNIISGETKTVILATYTPPGANYTFKTWIESPNGNVDENPDNDMLDVSVAVFTPVALPLFEDFESASFDPTPSGIYVSNPDADVYEWERSPNFGGYGTSTGSALFDNFSALGGQGNLDALVTPIYEFDDPTETMLTYDYAYSYYPGGGAPATPNYDSLIIAVSVDCGNNYDHIIYRNGGQSLATTQAYVSSFQPFPNEWVSNTIDLSSLGTPENITIAFINKSGYGNNLYLDNINILGACTLATSPDINQISCFGECDASVQIVTTGNSGGLTYTWSDALGGPTDDTVTGLCAGNYSVTILEDGGCERVENFTIVEPQEILWNETITGETANGANDGTITIAPTGGTPTYTIIWPAPIAVGTTSAVSLSPGTYSITLEDGNGCIDILDAVVEPYDCSDFIVTGIAQDVDCQGAQTGAIDLTVTGGVGTYVFNWDVPGTMGEDPTGLAVGPYNVTVTDDNNCEHQLDFLISEPDALTLNISSTDETGIGTNDGTATAMAGGGVGAYTYDWGAQGTGPTVSGLSPGTYMVTAYDGNNCPIMGEVTIIEFSCDNLSATATTTGVACFGGINGTAQMMSNGTNPVNYEWSVPGSLGSIHLTMPAGPFTVTVTDANSCVTIYNGVIDGPEELEVNLIVDETIACAGDANAALSSSYVGGTDPIVSYLWNANAGSATTPNVTGLSAGYYILTLTDDRGCTGIGEYIFDEPTALSVTFDVTEPDCFGASNGSIVAIPAGGTGDIDFVWNVPQSSLSLVGLDPGTYSITLTDANGCEIEEDIVLDGPPEIITSYSVTNESTAGANDGAITATGSANLVFYWGPVYGNSTSLSGLTPGTYPVTVSDGAGCEIMEEVNVLAGNVDCSTLDAIIEFMPISCFGANDGTANAVATGGMEDYIYQWSNTVNGPVVTGLPAGPIIVTITDANNCQIERTIVITEPDEIIPSYIITHESAAGANDGAITASGVGGVGGIIFDWGPPWGITNSLSGLSPGTYPVIIIDASGCEIVDQVVILPGNVDCSTLGADIGFTTVTCPGANDGTAFVQGFGGTADYTYQWSVPQSGQTVIGLSPGIVSVTVTDANMCQVETSVAITEPDAIVPSFTLTHESTAGASDGAISASGIGGTGNLNFDWGPPWGSTTDLSGLPPGTYTVTISDALNCSVIEEVIILAGGVNCATLSATFEIFPVSCTGFNDGMVNAQAFGGQENYQYDWSISAIGPSLIGLAPGSIGVTITDANGCEYFDVVTITEPDPLAVSITATNESSLGANDGTILAAGSGGTGTLTYDWGAAGTGQNLSSLAPGTYTLLMSDENNCILEEIVIIEEGPMGCAGFGTDLVVTQISCFDANDGSIVATGFGGDNDYSYIWSNSQTGPVATGLEPGAVSVTVSDASGCEITQSVILGNPTPITATTSSTMASTPTTADGSVQANGNGGTGILTYTWSDPSMQSGQLATGLLPGLYMVTIEDEQGCEIVETIEVMAMGVDCSSFTGTVFSVAPPCGQMEGNAIVALNNLIDPVEYIWSEPGTPNLPSVNLPIGAYSVEVINGNGCSIILTGSIDFVPEITLGSFMVFETSGPGNSDGSIDLIGISGGEGNLNINWSNMMMGPNITGLVAGTYTVTITDSGDCSFTQTFEVVDGAGCALAYTSNTIPASCNGLADGFAEVAPQGGSGTYNYQWSNSTNLSSITGPAGTYSVTISDNQGCSNIIQVEIGEPEVLGVQVLNFDGACGNLGGATANGTGGTPPFSYLWNNNETDRTITNLPAGMYTVTMTDDNNCETTGSASVSNDGTAFQVADAVENVSCHNAFDGSINLQIVQGTPPYDVLWDNGSTELIQTGLPAGNYSVQIMDGAGCNFISQYEVQSPGQINVLFDTDNPQAGEFDGSIMANVVGGQAPYSYNWSSGQNGPFIDGLDFGVYEVTITDDNGCTYTSSVALTMTSSYDIEGLASWKIFPNPSNGNVHINIQLNTPKALSIELYDIRGVLIRSITNRGNQFVEKIDVNQIAAGTYLVLLRDEDGNTARDKLVVIR